MLSQVKKLENVNIEGSLLEITDHMTLIRELQHFYHVLIFYSIIFLNIPLLYNTLHCLQILNSQTKVYLWLKFSIHKQSKVLSPFLLQWVPMLIVVHSSDFYSVVFSITSSLAWLIKFPPTVKKKHRSHFVAISCLL